MAWGVAILVVINLPVYMIYMFRLDALAPRNPLRYMGEVRHLPSQSAGGG